MVNFIALYIFILYNSNSNSYYSFCNEWVVFCLNSFFLFIHLAIYYTNIFIVMKKINK